MKKLNKKGFTLIELLAVIVVLAIIMVIAATQVGKAIETSRNGAYVSTYKMIVKEVKNRILESDITNGTADITCDTDCATKYDISDKDYSLKIDGNATAGYTVVLQPATNGKFSNVNIECPVSTCFTSGTTSGSANAIAVKIDKEGKINVLTEDEANTAAGGSNSKKMISNTTTTTTKSKSNSN